MLTNTQYARDLISPSTIADLHRFGIELGMLHRHLALGKLNHLNFYPEARKSRSNGSGVFYIAEKNSGEKSMLLQVAPASVITSRHYHGRTNEIFHNLMGECFVCINGDDVALKGDSVEIGTRRVHQVRTADRVALTLIEMLGNPKGLVMDDHIYSDSWHV